MGLDAIAVFDVGKTVTKLTIVGEDGSVLDRIQRANQPVETAGLKRLDVDGIEDWLRASLPAVVGASRIRAIVPVAHGAAAALVGPGGLATAPLDYEQPIPADVRAAYDRQRDPFVATGSPALPCGLNLGAQLHFLETQEPGALADDVQILPWAQYWSYRLSGVAASEVTSLGCHSDLWLPFEARPSPLGVARGWARRLPPMRAAGDVLGTLLPAWASDTGLPADTRILCGLHDTNAALLAARGFPGISAAGVTVVSTGTWFIAMRSPGVGATVNAADLPQERDCLVNVDVSGRPIASARFMGGREIELLCRDDGLRLDAPELQASLVAVVPLVVSEGLLIRPPIVGGVGPYPHGRGGRVGPPSDRVARGGATALYAALMTDTLLALIGSAERVIIEGRFACVEAYVRALATLRPDLEIFVASVGLDLAFGACRLVLPHLPAPGSLTRVAPLLLDLSTYRARWCELIEQEERTA